MKTSSYLLATAKETPAGVEIVSHRLMLRAGMIRQLAAGIYSWLPTGLRVLGKVENIVREQMNLSGAQEVLMPSVQPGDIWKESGRWDHFGPELLRFEDRHDRDFCLGPTHEEVITTLINNEVRSYRQLPANFYQIQWKFRDEVRPRFGVMRCREFLMKDAYSFDVDRAGMEQSYKIMYETYEKIFTRLGLDFVAVEADSGAIGGSISHEFHVIADSGEDGIGVNEEVGFASNVELIDLSAPSTPRLQPSEEIRLVETRGVSTIAQLCDSMSVSPDKTIKTLLVRGNEAPIALIIRGDHELNVLKAEKIPDVVVPFQMETAQSITDFIGAEPGSIGPVNLNLKVYADYDAMQMSDFICGANQNDKHFAGVNWGRDCPEPIAMDLRKAADGDPCPGNPNQKINVKRGIEVGHVFQLGTKYSEAFSASFLDSSGNNQIFWMGCYGVGVSRIVAAAIEQNHDESGIVWPEQIAPFSISIIPINYHQSEQVRETSDKLYSDLSFLGVEVLLDDRDERPGVKFAESELIGVPHRLVVSERGIANRTVEYKHRTNNSVEHLQLSEVLDEVTSRVETS